MTPARTRHLRRSAKSGSSAPTAPAPKVRKWGLLAGVFLAAIIVATVALSLGWRTAGASLRRGANQNILLITLDTVRGDALGCYGGPAATPNLDRLARQGIRFEFAHAHAVVTLPSHASILTGRYPFEHGIRDNSGYRLALGMPTVATLLKTAGYRTAAFIGGFSLNARFGLAQGFDVYDDRIGETHGPIEFAMPERRAESVIAAADAWIRAQQARWFAWVHLFDAHAPYAPPAPFDQQYANQPYYGEIAYLDRQLLPLLDLVQQQSRPTLIVVTGDHGEALGDHGEATHGLFAYESTLRIPLIVAQSPAGQPAARHTETGSRVFARHIDLLPTILDIVSLAPPPGLQGRSLVGATDNPDLASYFEAMSASLNRGWAPLTGILAGREKFISLPLPELYDLSTDASETRNVVAGDSERRRLLGARLSAWNAAAGGSRHAETAETASRLRALGYASNAGHEPNGRFTEDDDPKRLIAVDAAIHRGIELYEAGRRADAIEVYRQIVQRHPRLAVAISHLAFLYWSEGAVQTAIGTLKQAMADGISESGIPSQLGIYLSETGSAREALPLLQTTAATTNDVDALNALGITYGHLGDAKRALETFAAILQLDPQNAMAYQNIAAVDVERGNLQGARDALEHAIAIDPKSARAYTGIGAVHFKEGRLDDAIQSWRHAVELDPTDYDALFNLSNQLLAAGRSAEARPYLERFVRSAPPSQYAPEIRRFAAFLRRR